MVDRQHIWLLAHKYWLDTNTTWYGTSLLRTTDGSATWLREDFPEDYFYALFFFDTTNGFMAGSEGKILKTTDGGEMWLPVQIDSTTWSGFPVFELKFYDRDLGFGFGGRYDIASVVWRTTDGGDRWRPENPGSSEPIYGVHFIDSVNTIAVGGDYDFGSSMVRTKDAGRTWEYIYLGIWGEARALSFRTPHEGYAPLGFAGTYMVTHDTGNTWTTYHTPDSSAVYDLQFTDSLHGFMVGENGAIFEYVPTVVDVSPGINIQALSPRLHQNYPNPFNPSTTIAYELEHPGEVTIRLFDVSGRYLATLLRERQPAGPHRVEFSPRGLASGTYLYELTTVSPAGRTSQVRKMILLK
jgi:hypothetical protein